MSIESATACAALPATGARLAFARGRSSHPSPDVRSPGSAAPGRGAHFGMLDGLRGVAAFMVLIGHATSVMMGHSLIPNKVMAVHFFFCLSGFVMGYAYEARLRAGMRTIDFMTARTVRLYPLLTLGGFLGGAAFLLCEPGFRLDLHGLAVIASGLLALPSPKMAFSVGYWPMNPPEWSLFMEMAAYLLFALTIRHASTRRLIVVIAVATLAYAFEIERRPGTEALYDRFCGMVAAFGMGLLVWRARRERWLPALHLPAPVPALAIVGACMVPAGWSTPATMLCILLAFPALIHAGAQRPGGGRTARWLGDISYPLYILHWPVLIVAKTIAGSHAPAWPIVIATCIAATALAHAALRLFDMPLRRAIALARAGRRVRVRDEAPIGMLVAARGLQ